VGDGGVGLAVRDITVLRARRAVMPGIGTTGATQSQSLLAAPGGVAGAAAAPADASGFYSLHGVYFSPEQFTSTADCLTAASAQGLPLELCR
jgi:hypothetical protein